MISDEPAPADDLELFDQLGMTPMFRLTATHPMGMCLVGDERLSARLSDVAPTTRLQPGRASSILRLSSPSYVIVQESYVRTSGWRRHVDSAGRTWGPFSDLVDYCVGGQASLVVLADAQPTVPLMLDGAEYLPNIRTGSLLSDMEFPHPVLGALQAYISRCDAEDA